jgi:hypothetical protein
VQIEQGTGLMLHKCARALIAALLLATPALAIEAQPRPPANVPSTTGTKASAATVAEKSNQHAATQATTKKAKHPNPGKAKSKVVKSKALNSKLGASNHRNSNRAMLAASKQEKSKKARPRPVENRTPTDTTGSVPSRSVLPALY